MRRANGGLADKIIVGVLLALVLGVVSLLAFYVFVVQVLLHPQGGPTTTIRYREEITYSVGRVRHTASGVREVSLAVKEGRPGSGVGVYLLQVRGQPIVLSDDDQGIVLALARYPYDPHQQAITRIEAACGPSRPIASGSGYGQRLKQWLETIAAFNRPCAVRSLDWPLIVRFRDPLRPETIERLASSSSINPDLPLPQLLSVVVEPTTDTLGTGLSDLLPWLASPKAIPWEAMQITGPSMRADLPNISLNVSDFIPEGEFQ